MWLRRFTNYLLQHPVIAFLLTLAITFIPVIGIVGILFATFITLRKGIVKGAIFTLAATLPYLLSFYLSGSRNETIPLVMWAAVGVAVLSNIFSWIFAVMFSRGSTWATILQVAALVGVLAISVMHLVYPNITDWWGTQLQSYYTQAQSMAGILKTANDAQLEAINNTKQYATGLMVAGILFNAILQLIIARWWEVSLFKPGELRRELHQIRLSQLAGTLFVVSLVFSYLGNSVVLDIMPILYLLFGAAGFSLIHYLFGLSQSKTTWFWMLVLYFALIFSLPASLIGVAIFGLLDVWFNFRKRFKKV